jgi:hypothetical protein
MNHRKSIQHTSAYALQSHPSRLRLGVFSTKRASLRSLYVLLCLILVQAGPALPADASGSTAHRAETSTSAPMAPGEQIVTPVLCPDVVAPPGVDTLDVQAVAARWPLTAANPDPDGNPATPNYEARYDIDHDGDVDIVDIMLTSSEWGTIGAPPGIEITSVPTYGVWGVPLRGRVGCVDPAAYKVAVYIFVEGWWNKPYAASPLTPIQPDGTWSTNVTTGGCDQLATRFAAFLLPNGVDPQGLGGGSGFSQTMLTYPHVIVGRLPGTRSIQFSGSTWVVKRTGTCRQVGPGPNYFSDDPADVWVDGDGQLHLRIVNRSGVWWSTEVINTDPAAYGTYTFTLASYVDTIDPNAVVGLFTWDDLGDPPAYGEIDVEFSRWGNPSAANNAQFVVQPYYAAGHLHPFPMQLQGELSTHRFEWQPDSVQFASYQGLASPPTPGDLIESWTYSGSDVPPPGRGNARINLWLFNGVPPTNGQPLELIVRSFQFSPAGP